MSVFINKIESRIIDCIKLLFVEFGAKWKMTSEEAKLYTGWNIFRDRKKKIIYVNQRDYIEKVKNEFGPLPQRSYTTPMDNNFDAKVDEGEECIEDQVPYGKLIGILLYLTQTRFDILYSTHLLAGFIKGCQRKHWEAAKRILFYTVTTKNLCLVLGQRTDSPLVAYAVLEDK